MTRKTMKIWSPEEREQYLQQQTPQASKNGHATTPVKETVNETIVQSVVDAVLDPPSAPEMVEDEISFFDLPDEPIVATRVVPQPDANGEFATPADGAKFMASFKIPQIPLRGKDPSIGGKGWQHKGTIDFDEIDRLAKTHPGCNFGSVAKAEAGGFYILETDSVKPKQQFTKDTGLPTFGAKLLIKSGPGRAHWYFAHTKESIALENIGQNNPEGFSLRLNNEQCVSPGSIHPERKTQYAVQFNGAPEPASLQLVEWLHAQKIAANIASKKGEARNDVGKIPLGMIHNFLLEEMGHLRGRGYTMEATEDALLAYSEQNCEVHDPAHIHQMVVSTEKWGDVNPLSKAVFVGGQLSGTSPHTGTPSTPSQPPQVEEVQALVSVDGDAFMQEIIAPRKTLLQLVDKKHPIFTEQSINQIYAWRGIGKTCVGYGLTAAFANGTALLNWEAPQRARVLYVEGELPAAQAQERWKQIVGATNGYARLITIDKQPGHIIPSLATAIGMARVEKTLADLETQGFKVQVLVLDSISTLFNITANDEEAWITIQAWLISLRSRGLCIFFFHHAGKSGLSRSHSKSEDMLDVSIKLDEPKDRDSNCLHAVIHYDKARAGFSESDYEIKMHRAHSEKCPCIANPRLIGCLGDSVRWEHIAQGENKRFEAERRFASGMSDGDIATELDIVPSTVRSWRKKWKMKADKLKGIAVAS